jgi:hypothetical protein
MWHWQVAGESVRVWLGREPAKVSEKMLLAVFSALDSILFQGAGVVVASRRSWERSSLRSLGM